MGSPRLEINKDSLLNAIAATNAEFEEKREKFTRAVSALAIEIWENYKDEWRSLGDGEKGSWSDNTQLRA